MADIIGQLLDLDGEEYKQHLCQIDDCADAKRPACPAWGQRQQARLSFVSDEQDGLTVNVTAALGNRSSPKYTGRPAAKCSLAASLESFATA